tara:strand:- start:1479 stop:2534 length:1056 start_codon:yes stop_codon:yes gene_type:complete
MKKKVFTYTEAVNLALHEVMESNPKSICMGLGINDPKRIFNTTKDLVENFGEERIIEPPTSENALTGIAFGLTLKGYSVCLIHQRFDFSLLSFDQLINTVSKWNFMFGNKEEKHSLLIRLIIGRGWGQGPTHSQSYHSFLSSLPGVNVLYPFDPNSAYHTIKYGMTSKMPTLMIEHRWLHNSKSLIFDGLKNLVIKNSKKKNHSLNFTIFCYGYMIPETLKAHEILKKKSINLDILTTYDLSKINYKEILESIKVTNNLLLIECFTEECSIVNNISSEILKNQKSKINLNSFGILSLPSEHESTSFFKTKTRYNTYQEIVNYILLKLDKEILIKEGSELHDIPGDWFKGPF